MCYTCTLRYFEDVNNWGNVKFHKSLYTLKKIKVFIMIMI